ncbi:unnamed protein product [Litomosoides sigmodontis]|uniref:Uncharacterized protein n=1 Tax=Litomosoides sigmodontis TaxID=42156 RepID=A0A3P6SFQ8_LITSI|nr:unnamed protein product [Litomosoides sigmodontis]
MQQQHSAAASNSGLSAAVPAVEPTTVTVVDRLKHQLLQAYDNVRLKGVGGVNMGPKPGKRCRRHRTCHGCDHQIGEVQFDEGITRDRLCERQEREREREEGERRGVVLCRGRRRGNCPCTAENIRAGSSVGDWCFGIYLVPGERSIR